MDERHRQAVFAGAATTAIVAAIGFLFFAPDRGTQAPSTPAPSPPVSCEDWHVVPVGDLGTTTGALHDVDGTPADAWAVGGRAQGPLILHAIDGTWKLLVPDLRGIRGAVTLHGVSVLGNQVWAVGAATTDRGTVPVIMRGSDEGVAPVRLPRGLPDDTTLLAIDATREGFVAVGGSGDVDEGTGTPVIVASDDGERWRPERPRSETGVLRDVVVTPSGSIVAVGFRGDPAERVSIPFAEARSGPRFREFLAEERARNALYAAAPATRGDVWALGTMAALFDERGFTRVPVSLTGTTILGVTQTSPKRADGVGVRQTQGGPQPVFAAWDGERWGPVREPATSELPGTLEAIVLARSGSGWAVGTRETADGGQALVLRKGC
jgi:hypothetical protein